MSNSIKALEEHLKTHNFKIQGANSRFTDQKCTPDVVSSIADCIEYFIENNDNEFTIRDIWKSDYANQLMTDFYQKPSVFSENVNNEYDKFFSQPIKLLEHAKIIEAVGKRGRSIAYKVVEFEILEFIKIHERKALDFLVKYLTKTLEDSGIYHLFEDYFRSQAKESFSRLRSSFIEFMLANTKINEKQEITRIFTKVLNPLSFNKRALGTEGGHLSKHPIQYSSLMYNRVNFRDNDKPKHISRKEFLEQSVLEDTVTEKYAVNKAKKEVLKHHKSQNEVNRFDSNPDVHVHHMFPQHMYPELSDKFENLVLINPTQHLSFAHPGGNTKEIAPGYQLLCLLAKLSAAQTSIINQDGFYDMREFINVINTGHDKEVLSISMTYEQIQNELVKLYI